MIINDNKNTLVMSQNLTTTDFGIDNEDLQHIISLLRNDIYSNKHLAILRELSCNAMDANIAAGKTTTPIRINLPSQFNPVLKIRDFGNGLDYEDMVSIYSRYGKSTKRNSNNMVGAFGLGTKSPWSLYSSFLVDSYQGGIKSSYTCVLDESNVGKLVVLGNFPTTEPDGIEVTVSVAEDDIKIFRDTANTFFKYWDVMPEIEGFTQDDYAAIRGQYEIDLTGTGWEIRSHPNSGRYYRSNSTMTALMGNIAYPISTGNIKGLEAAFKAKYGADYNTYDINNFLSHNIIVFRFAIGEVKMAPSREVLQYNDTTCNSIISRILTMLDEIGKSVQDKVNAAAHIWEAKSIYSDLFEDYGSLYNLKNSIKVTYKGHEIKSSRLNGLEKYVSSDKQDVFKTYHRRSETKTFVSHCPTEHYWNTISCNKKHVILEVDQDKQVYVQKAVKHLADTLKVNTVYTMNFYNDTALRNTVFTEMGLEDSFIIKYSSIGDAVKRTVSTAPRAVTVKKNVDSNIKSVRYISNKIKDWDASSFVKLPKVEHDLTTGGIYVEVKGSDIVDNADNWTFERILLFIQQAAKRLYDDNEVVVHFIASNLVDGKAMKKGNWVKFSDYYKTESAKLMDKYADLNVVMAYSESTYSKLDCDYMTFMRSLNNPVLNKLVELHDKNSDQKDIFHLVGKLPDAYVDAGKVLFDSIINEIEAKYPLLKTFNPAFRFAHYSYPDYKAITNYFQNGVDKVTEVV